MVYKIKSNGHRAWPFLFGLWYNKKYLCKKVRFMPSCAYDFNSLDQLDSNKLFGIGYLWHHHKDSARFGWRYNPIWQKIELIAYCYIDGERIIKPFYEVALNELLILKLRIVAGGYVFNVKDEKGKLLASVSIPYNHKKKWAYPLGIYFGGSRKCPHDMKIEMTNGK